MPNRRPKRTRLLLAALGALLLHTAAIALLGWLFPFPHPQPQPQATATTAPVRLVRLPATPPEPSPKPSPRPAPLSTHTPSAKPQTDAQPTAQLASPTGPSMQPDRKPDPPATEYPEGHDVPPIAASGPRLVDLFPAGTVQEIAASPEQATEEELVTARLKNWTEQYREVQRVRNGDVTPALQRLSHRFEGWLLVTPEMLSRSAPFGLGVGSTGLSLWNSWRSDLDNIRDITRRGPDRSNTRELLGDPGGIGPRLVFCLEDCQTRGHLVAIKVVLIEIDHNTSGEPQNWRIFESSGDAVFDEAALDAVDTAMRFIPDGELKDDPVTSYSRWEVSAAAYRYTPNELLDPLLEHPGRRLDEHSGLLGETRLVRKAKLVAVRYYASPTPRSGK